MQYKIFVNNPWQENTVVLYDKLGEAVVIDCGCFSDAEEKKMKVFFESEGLKPVALLNTHLHPDHVFGNGFMKREYNLETKASKEDNFFLENTVEYAAKLGLQGVTQPPVMGEELKDGDVVRFGESELQVIAVKGHSPGGLCFYNAECGLLVAGDVLFAGSVGRSDLPGGDGAKLISDIRKKLFTLPDDVQVISGHGPMTSIGGEKRNNPYFK